MTEYSAKEYLDVEFFFFFFHLEKALLTHTAAKAPQSDSFALKKDF